jgi:hypothetical protein
MIRNGIAEAAARLGAQWPDWAIWWVPRATGRPAVTWHARRRDDKHVVIHATSPDDLELELEFTKEAGQ